MRVFKQGSIGTLVVLSVLALLLTVACAGPAGTQGPAGASGSGGAQGAQGAAGPQGPAGAAGDQGSTGYPGAEGPKGAQGATGSKGDTGPTQPASVILSDGVNGGQPLTVAAGVATFTVTGSGFPAGAYLIGELHKSDGSSLILKLDSGDATASLGGVFSSVLSTNKSSLSAGVYSVVLTAATGDANINASAPLVVE